MLSSVAARAQSAARRDLSGTISDVGGAPVAGATLAIAGGGPATTTAGDGSFRLEVDTSDLVIEVTAEGFVARRIPLAAAATALQLDLVLVKPPPPAAAVSDEKPVAAAPADSAPPAPAQRAIHGKVSDPATREAIAAAQVQIAGSQTVVFTGADGSFTIEGAPPGPVELAVSAPGYDDRQIAVPPELTVVDVALPLTQGEQIVIESRAPVLVKQNLVNGASVVDGKDLNRVTTTTLDEAMAGKLAGANLQSNSGAPGGGAQLRLRGVSTINGQFSPLYVIDGVIISNAAIPSGISVVTGAGTTNQDNPVNRIADLNPSDIESVEVLKGASAAALYGSKAANGVVIITTKRGRNGENHASVTQRLGVAQVSRTLGSRRFASIDDVRASFCNLAMQTPSECDGTPLLRAYVAAAGKTYDHEAELERTQVQRETLASVSGGTKNASYFGSMLVADDPGVITGTFYRKQTGRVAIGYELGSAVHLGFTANLVHSLSDRGLTNNDNTGVSNYVVLAATPSFVDLAPMHGVYPVNPAIGSGANALQTVAEFQNREEVWRFITGANVALDAYGDRSHKLRVLANFGADSFTQKNNVLSPNDLTFEPADGLPGTSVDATTTNLNWNLGASAIWDYKPDSDAFHSALSTGVIYESVARNSIYVVARGLTAGQPNIGSGSSIQPSQNRLETKESGLYLQEELSFLTGRLSLLGALLGERSSLNGDHRQYYLYPKAAAVLSLLDPRARTGALASSFDTLRLRAAYGEAGNRPNYGDKFTPLVTTSKIDGHPGAVLLGPGGALAGDPAIRPELQREFELGVDAVLSDQRAVIELTGYQRNISNLLLQRALPTSTGFTTQFLNGGGLRNRGLEAAVQVRPISTGLAEWTSRAVLTLNRSMITSLPGGVAPFIINPAGAGAGLGAFRIAPGRSATEIVATVGPDGTLMSVGNSEPDFRIGWSNVVTAGGFTFSALVDWQHGSDVINLTRLLYDLSSNSPDAAAAGKRLTTFIAGSDPRPYIEDASFVKLRELAVSYRLPGRLVSQLGPLRTLELGLAGRNLLTLTRYSGLDPEVSNFGGQSIGRNFDVAPYPPSRTYWLSITAGI